MLSSQTKDQTTFAAMERLKKHGLTIPNVMKSSEAKIKELIYPVGFASVGKHLNTNIAPNNSIFLF